MAEVTDAEIMVLAVELAEAAIDTRARLDERLLGLVTDPTGDFALSIVVALVTIIARVNGEVGSDVVGDVLDRIRSAARSSPSAGDH